MKTKTAAKVKKVKTQVKSKVKTLKTNAKAKVTKAKAKVVSKVNAKVKPQAMSEMKAKANQIRAKATELKNKAEGYVTKAEDMVDVAKKKFADTNEAISNSYTKARQDLKQEIKNVEDKIETTIKEKPMAVASAAAGVGLIVGKLMSGKSKSR